MNKKVRDRIQLKEEKWQEYEEDEEDINNGKDD